VIVPVTLLLTPVASTRPLAKDVSVGAVDAKAVNVPDTEPVGVVALDAAM
jgi:hypothetical protein